MSFLILIILFWVTLPSKKVKVIFCDVGQGDAVLVIYKDQQIMIDTGPDNKRALNCLEKYTPFWDKKIEMVIITHGDSDHIGGLKDMSKFYKIEQIIDSKKVSQSDLIKTSWMVFEVVNPREKTKEDEDKNENSISGILKYGKTSIFLSGDIDRETEQRLVWSKIVKDKIDVLKVSHHGSSNGTSEELLNILKPKMAVISVGAKNKFGHPTREVLDRLEKREILVKRTDILGDVIIED
jgi:competence protein ComEC